MKQKLKNKLVTHTLIYTGTDAISKALSFLTLPFISFYIVPEQLGIAANFSVLQSILMLLAGQAIVNALPYFYYDRPQEKVATLVSNLIVLILALNVLFCAIIMVTTSLIEDYIQIGLSLQLLTIVCVITQLIAGINTVLYRLEEKPFAFATVQMVQTVLYLGLLIYLVIFLRMEAIGKIYSATLAYLIMFFVHVYFLIKRKYIVCKFSKDSIKELLRFGIPLLPHSLSFWIKSGMDKILLTTYCGLAANGLYSMAMSFGAMYSIFNTAFSNAYVPHLQKKINSMTPETEAIEKRNIVLFSYKIFSGFVVLYFILVAICWFAMNYMLDVSYKESFDFIPWIFLSLTLQSLYTLVIQFPYTVKKTLGLGVITCGGSIIQLALTYILIRLYGIDGIKYSMVIGTLIITIAVWWYSNRVYPMPWLKLTSFK